MKGVSEMIPATDQGLSEPQMSPEVREPGRAKLEVQT